MPHYDKAHFLAQFAQRDTNELIERALTRELTDEAQEAIRQILQERGIEGHALELRVQDVQKDFFRRSGVTNQCDFCGRNVVGPVRDGTQKFCNQDCLRRARLLEFSIGLPADIIVEHARAMRVKPCPQCGRSGGIVEMRPSFLVFSAIWIVAYRNEHALCCRRCGVRNSLQSALACLLFGWWSLPGLFATPSRIGRNIFAALRWKAPDQPSKQLMLRARLEVAESMQSFDATQDLSRVPLSAGS